MKVARALGLVMLAAACVAAGARAQDAAVPDTVDLAAVMRLARDASPRMALERQGIAQAQADRITAGAYPNPTLNYGRFRPSAGRATLFEGSHQQETTLELPLLIAGQRGARIERAERAIEAARARVAAGASTLAAEAGAAYTALLAAQEKVAQRAAAQQEVVRLRDLVAGRQESGVASRYDVARLDVELGGLRAKVEEARADVADRSGTLAALLGLPGWRPVASGTLAPLRLDPRALSTPPRDAALTTPAAVAAAREESAAQSGIDVARRERWPVPAVSVGRTWTSDPFGAANFMGLSVEVPIFDTRRGPLARAEADAHAATLRRRLVTAETAANIQRLENVIAGRQAALDQFEKEAAARLPPIRQMAEDAYRLGRATILELLDATRSRYELQQIRTDLAAALLEAQVRFLATLGELDRYDTSAPPVRP